MKKTLLLFIACLGLGLAACSKTSTATKQSADTSTSTKTEKVTSNKTLRVATATDIDNLDPYLSAATDTQAMMDNVFDGLLDTDEKGNLINNLAEKYTISSDKLTYTFDLVKGAHFHNGKEVTAADVVYSYDKLAGLAGQKALSSKWKNVLAVKEKSTYQVVVTLKSPDASFLALNTVAIVPKDYTEQGTKPIGAGPFKFVSYTAGSKLVLERNDDYYKKESVPKVKTVEFVIMKDEQSSLLAMQAGEIDVLPGISAQGLKQLGDKVKAISGPQNMVQIFALNNSYGPLKDKKVRQAINMAVDKDKIIKTVADGKGTKLGSNFSPAMATFYQDGLENYYKVNLKKAKQLLQEAGYANGFDLQITVPSDYQFHVDTAQMLSDQLSKIGIKVKIVPIEWSTWLDQVYGKGDYQSTVIGFTGKLDPNEVLVRFSSDYAKNFVHYKNAAYDKLITDALKEMDQTKRVKLYQDAQKKLTTDAVSVFIMDPDRTIAFKKEISGLELYPIQKYNLEDVSMK